MLQIAWITLRRITERAILVQFGILALVLIYVGLGLDRIILTDSVGSEQSGIGVGWVFLSIFTVFWSTLEIPREIERKEVHVYLAKPITRFRYLLGKYLGMTTMVLTGEAGLMLIFAACLLIKGFHPSALFFFGVARMALFLVLLNAVCVAASMLLGEVRAMMTVLVLMGAGLMVVALAVIAWSSFDVLPAAALAGAYHLLPDLLHYRWEPASGLPAYLGLLAVYTAGWSILCLIIARAFFERFDLP